MPVDVTEATFEQEVVERSRSLPVVVDFWAEWCGPCRTLSPALAAAEAARAGKVVLAKVDVDSNQGLSARYGVQGIPAVKAFRDGAVVDEFVGAVPKAKVEELFDSLAPSRADELLAKGDELSLREANELEPNRADIAVALARARLERGADKQTDAMKAAMRETDRRRAIQLAHNEEHEITAATVTKGISEMAEFLAMEDRAPRKRRGRRATDAQDPEELEKTIVSLEEEMLAAADDLRFEEAARLRDELKELRRDLDGMRAGA